MVPVMRALSLLFVVTSALLVPSVHGAFTRAACLGNDCIQIFEGHVCFYPSPRGIDANLFALCATGNLTILLNKHIY